MLYILRRVLKRVYLVIVKKLIKITYIPKIKKAKISAYFYLVYNLLIIFLFKALYN